MNNAKMWLVVKPTVGVPLFLSAVAIGSFAVHVAVLTNTSWVGDFLSGKPLGSGAVTAALDATAPVATVAHTGVVTGQTVLIRMADGSVAHATIEMPAVATH